MNSLPFYTQHLQINNQAFSYPVGKAVCVGRNYADHAKELGNPVPAKPLLFIKPNTAFTPLQQALTLPTHGTRCGYETEIAVLIGQPLSHANTEQAAQAIVGLGLALDLTLRDVQDELKAQRYPWELAKAFDKACPISPFVAINEFKELNNIAFTLTVNNELKQNGNSAQMTLAIIDLLVYITQYFSLLAGDVVLTGTPAGVGELHSGDQLVLTLDNRFSFSTHVL